MFSNIINSVKVAWNLEKIKSIMVASYDAVTKVLAALKFLQGQLSGNSELVLTLVKYLPLIITVLTKVVSVVDTYGGLLGIIAMTSVQDDEPVTSDKLHADLVTSLNNLTNELRK